MRRLRAAIAAGHATANKASRTLDNANDRLEDLEVLTKLAVALLEDIQDGIDFAVVIGDKELPVKIRMIIDED